MPADRSGPVDPDEGGEAPCLLPLFEDEPDDDTDGADDAGSAAGADGS